MRLKIKVSRLTQRLSAFLQPNNKRREGFATDPRSFGPSLPALRIINLLSRVNNLKRTEQVCLVPRYQGR